MAIDKDELVSKIKELLKPEVTKISYDTWILPLDIRSIENDNIVFTTTSEYQKDFIENKEIISTLEFWGAYDNRELKGVIATNKNRRHICCFFVKARYHRQGIGRKLWEYLLANSSSEVITVNSSPYAVPVYRKLGFVDTDAEQLSDGMRYTPMKYKR